MRRVECLERLATVITAVRLSHPTRVAIDGVDGAGKTSMADELVEPLARSGRPVIRASVDGFHHPRATRYRRGRDSADAYFRDSFDYAAVIRELLEPLGPDGSRRFRVATFDHRSDQPVIADQQMAAADAILVFDGVFLQRPELGRFWDLRVWVDAPFEVTVARAVGRDSQGQDAGTVLAMYERRYVPGQAMYLNECRPRESAHIVVDNSDLDNPEIRRRYTKPRR